MGQGDERVYSIGSRDELGSKARGVASGRGWVVPFIYVGKTLARAETSQLPSFRERLHLQS